MQRAARRQAKQEELKRLHRAQVHAGSGTLRAGGRGVTSVPPEGLIYSQEGEEARAEAERGIHGFQDDGLKVPQSTLYRGQSL